MRALRPYATRCSLLLAWLLLGPAAVLLPARAHAAATHGVRETLRVRPGASCVTADALAAQVLNWLQSDRVHASTTIEVEGSTRDPRRVSFRVVQHGRVLAHRVFDPGPPQCEHLHAALGLSIALALKATLLEELGEPLDDDPAARARGIAIAANALVATDVLPGLSAGVDLRAELLLPPSVSLRAGVLGLGGFDKTLARQSGEFDAGLLALHVDGCAGMPLARDLRGRVCVGVLGGPLYAAGRSFVKSDASVVGWIGFTNSLAALLDLSDHLSLELSAAVLAPLRRVSIGVRDEAGRVVDARDLASVGFSLGFGPIYRL